MVQEYGFSAASATTKVQDFLDLQIGKNEASAEEILSYIKIIEELEGYESSLETVRRELDNYKKLAQAITKINYEVAGSIAAVQKMNSSFSGASSIYGDFQQAQKEIEDYGSISLKTYEAIISNNYDYIDLFTIANDGTIQLKESLEGVKEIIKTSSIEQLIKDAEGYYETVKELNNQIVKESLLPDADRDLIKKWTEDAALAQKTGDELTTNINIMRMAFNNLGKEANETSEDLEDYKGILHQLLFLELKQ